MCEFCSKFDFSKARVDIRKDTAHIELALCNSSFSEEQQFKFCPMCGEKLNKIITPYNIGDIVLLDGKDKVKIVNVFVDPDDHKRYAKVVPSWEGAPNFPREVLYSRLKKL